MKIPTMTSPLPGFPGRVFSFNRRPVLTAMLGLLLGWDASLQAQSLWTNTISGSWGNGTNWSPVGIPNATNAVVTLSNININCLNTPENIALWTSGPTNFPYKFGTLNLGTGNCGSDTANDQLMAVVTAGTPVINLSSGSCYFYSVIYGNQGFNKTGAGNMTFRYGQSQVFTGNVGVLGGGIAN